MTPTLAGRWQTLQDAAMRAVDALQEFKPPGLRRLNRMYSLQQWSKWASGAQP